MYCVLNMGWTPSQFMNLSYKEKMFVTACVLTKVEEEKKQAQKMKSKASNVRRG